MSRYCVVLGGSERNERARELYYFRLSFEMSDTTQPDPTRTDRYGNQAIIKVTVITSLKKKTLL